MMKILMTALLFAAFLGGCQASVVTPSDTPSPLKQDPPPLVAPTPSVSHRVEDHATQPAGGGGGYDLHVGPVMSGQTVHINSAPVPVVVTPVPAVPVPAPPVAVPVQATPLP